MYKPLPLMEREMIKLFPPSRPHADTEYNLHYKNWPQLTHMMRHGNHSPVGPSTIPHYQTHSGTSKLPRYYSATSFPNSLEVHPASHHNDDFFHNYKSISAPRGQTAVLHHRPHHPKQVKSRTKKTKAETNLHSDHHDASEKAMIKLGHRREAWGVEEGDSTTSQSELKMSDLCNAIDRIDRINCWGKTSKEICNVDEEPSSTYSNIDRICSEQSVIDLKPFHSDNRSNSRVNIMPSPSYLCTNSCRKARNTERGLSDHQLRKLYESIPKSDLERLNHDFKGISGPKKSKGKKEEKREVKKEVKTEEKKEPPPLNVLRYPTTSSDDNPFVGPRLQENWVTLYNSNYRRWDRSDINQFSQSEKTASEVTDASQESNEYEDENEDYYEETPPEFRTNGEKSRDARERNKVTIKDPDRDKRQRRMGKRDSKSKFGKTYTSNQQDSRDSMALKEAEAARVNKIFATYGSPHWNIPAKKGDNWKLEAEEAHRKTNEVYPMGVEKQRQHRSKKGYKIKVYEPSEEEGTDSEDDNEASKNPFITLYYPDKRITPTYLSEYTRRFHRLPPQRRYRM